MDLMQLQSYPRIQYFVAESEGQIIGYIEWLQKSGLRKEVVLELEQMAVVPSFQGRGIVRGLIQKSLPRISQQVAERGASLKHVMVTTSPHFS
jgi:predicted N-acetyltransferase YhbS